MASQTFILEQERVIIDATLAARKLADGAQLELIHTGKGLYEENTTDWTRVWNSALTTKKALSELIGLLEPFVIEASNEVN